MTKGLQNLPVSFEENHLTHFGGMLLIHSFCKKLKFKRLLQRHLRPLPRYRDYHPSEMILAICYAIIAGMDRVNATQILQYNGAFQKIIGLAQFPDQTAIRRFLLRLSPKTIRQIVQLHDFLRQRLFGIPKARTSLVLDLDSVVIVIYGKAQGARVGYNPKKPGRRSYHPLLCFESHSQEFWHGSLRPGNAAASTGAISFLKICLAKVPKTIAYSRVRIRADSGFFRKRIVEFIDGRGCGYVIVAKKYSTIKTRAQECRFQSLKNGWQTGEFKYRPHSWKREHRFVVVRIPISQEPVETKQLILFKDQKYVYHVFVTNLKVHPWRVYRFYRPRARVEKNIRELLYDYPMGKIPTKDWVANVAYFQLLLLAFDIMHYFKRACLPESYRFKTLKTVRMELLVIPARLVKSKNRYCLKLPGDYHFKKVYQDALTAIDKIKSL